MSFCPYITSQILVSSHVDGTSTMYDYTTSLYTCPQNNTCKVWDISSNDCGSKNPLPTTAAPSPSTLLNEYLSKVDSDGLDLSSIGVIGDSIYGEDFMIDDTDLPVILKAANDHPDFPSDLEDKVSGRGTLTMIQSGWDSTSSWIYRLTVIDGTIDYEGSPIVFDGTSDFLGLGIDGTSSTSLVYISTLPESTYRSLEITGALNDEPSLLINIGTVAKTHPDVPITPGTYTFKIDRKKITFDEYLGLF